jgi:hypothetical protein
MSYPVVVEDAEKLATLTLAATVNPGDLLGYNSGWVLADSTVSTIYYAQWIALEHGVSGQRIKVAKRAVLYDQDAPYTAASLLYLSGTAGGVTHTRPTTDGDLRQVVGIAIDTYRAEIEIKPVQQVEVFISPDTLDTTGEPGLGAADAGWAGPQVDGAGETFYFKGRIPENVVGSIVAAKVLFNSINASAFDCDFSIVGAYDGASNVQDTGTAITAGDWEQADTDNIIYTVDVSALFDAGFFLPGRAFCVLGDPDGITADATVVGLYMTYNVV